MAVTVAYLSPVTGATAPTALQSRAATVRATVIATADGDAAATITHNFGLTAAELALGRPDVTLIPGIAESAAARLSAWTVTALGTNTITLAKTTAGGSGAAGIQLHVTIRRPHSIIGQ